MLETDAIVPGTSITEILSLDHRRIDAGLADVKRSAAAQDLPLACLDFADFRRRLARHIAIEEELLFPAFEKLTGVRAAGPLEVMRLEHAQMLRLLPAVAALLAGDDAKARTTGLGELTARLFAHNGKEDRILYPMIDRAASGALESQALVGRICAHLSSET